MAVAALAPIIVTFLAVALVARQRRIVEQLRSAGATRPERATSPAALGLGTGMAYGILLRHGVVKSSSELVYLDEPAWEALRARRRHRLLLLVPIFVVVGLLLWILYIALQ
jgi:hypothetical protein